MEFSKKKLGYSVIVAATVFLYRSWLIYAEQGIINAKIIIFLSMTAFFFILGLLLIAFSKQSSNESTTKTDTDNKIKQIISIFMVSLLIGLGSFWYKSNKAEKIEATKQHFSQIISGSDIQPYKLIAVTSLKKTKFNVPEDLDSSYAYFGEGLPHQGWQADSLIQAPEGTVQKYKIYISKDNKILHTIPFDLIRILTSKADPTDAADQLKRIKNEKQINK